MAWHASTLWWLAAGLLVGAELLTGTFYLLMLAVGVAAGGVAAWLGLGLGAQLTVAALVGGGAVAGWHVMRSRRQPRPGAEANRDLNLDLGEQVMVAAWNEQGQATVQYRGAAWQAVHRGEGPPRPGPHAIVAIEAIHLVLTPVAP